MKFIAILILAVPLLFICFELSARIVGVSPAQDLLSSDLATYESVPGIWAPGQNFTWHNMPSLPYKVRINSAGYRGKEFDTQKGPDEYRVLMVGDSFTFGVNVNEVESLPHKLQQELYQSCETEQFTSINAGIPGSTIRGQLEMVSRGLPLNPDVVVLVFTETDIPDLTDPLWDQMAENRKVVSKFPVSLFWSLFRDSATWALVSNFREKMEMQRQYEMNESNNMDEHSHDELKRTYLEQLNKLAALVEQQGASFVVVTFPGNHTARGEPYIDTTYWAMEEFPKHGITTVDLLEPLQKALGRNTDSAFLLPDDGHPSKIGYEVAASTIASQLMMHPVLQERCLDLQ